MGWKIKAAVAKAFRTQSNKAYRRRLQTETLFSRVSFLHLQSFRCHAKNGVCVSQGDSVAIVRLKTKVQIWSEDRVIGEIEEAEAAELMAEREMVGKQVMMARVEDGVGMDGRFSIVLSEEVSDIERIFQ
jgi:hypothetical protein